jgi:hypothetical protein
LSRDPIEERGGINIYGYVKNNTVNLIDLLGLKIIKSGIKVCTDGFHGWLAWDGGSAGFYPQEYSKSNSQVVNSTITTLGIIGGHFSGRINSPDIYDNNNKYCIDVLIDTCIFDNEKFVNCIKNSDSSFPSNYAILGNNCWHWVLQRLAVCFVKAIK